MTMFAAGGLSIDLPTGWDAQIRRPDLAGAGLKPAEASRSAPAPTLAGGPALLHAASFALPPQRGDYGSGAVEIMGGSDILICLLEHEPEAAGTALFRREGLPRLSPSQFSPQSMQRAIPGMAGSQHFFQMAGRPFCLYVVVGSWRTRGPLVRTADSVVQTIRFS